MISAKNKFQESEISFWENLGNQEFEYVSNSKSKKNSTISTSFSEENQVDSFPLAVRIDSLKIDRIEKAARTNFQNLVFSERSEIFGNFQNRSWIVSKSFVCHISWEFDRSKMLLLSNGTVSTMSEQNTICIHRLTWIICSTSFFAST